MNRRNFTKVAVTRAAGLSMSPTILTGSGWKGANDRVNIAVIGIRSQGQLHIAGYSASKNARVAAICDVDSNLVAERVKKHFTDKGLPEPKNYTDLRKVFENKDIDAVSIATPNHWHALATIWACQAGKDVYVEKPGAHNIREGRKMVEAAAKYDRIVQHGVQLRSSEALQEAVQLLRKGIIGKVYMARGLVYRWRPSIGHKPDEPNPPANLNWDIW